MAMPLWPAFGTVAVGYRFAQVFRLNGPGFCQVCRGSGHPQYTIHAPRGQIQLFYRLVQQCSKLPIETAVYSQLLIVQQVILLAGARQLPAIGADDPVAYLRAGLGPFILQFLQDVRRDIRDFDVHVDPVQQRARYLAPVAPDLFNTAPAAPAVVAIMAAGAGVHGGDQLKPGRVFGLSCSPGNADFTCFQWLPQGFEDRAVELRQLIQEQDAVMRQRYLSRAGLTAATHQGDG